MVLNALKPLEILEGSLALIWVLIAIIVGIRIIWKAFVLSRTKDLITVGLSYIFMSSAWFGVAFQFITYGLFDFLLDDFTYLLISNILIPFAMICWIYSYCQIVKSPYKKNLMIIYIIFSIIWEVYVIAGLIINIDLVGKVNGIFDSSHSTIMLIFILTGIISFLVTGTIIAFKSMKLGNQEVQIKGKFLMLAWISFTVGSLLDAMLPLSALTLIIIRIVLISSAIEFYFGFFLPMKLIEKISI